MLYHYKAKLIRVIDGDTVKVAIDLGLGVTKKETLRLLMVNTPEIRTKNKKEKVQAYKAKRFVEDWFSEHNLECRVKTFKDKKGKYGRYLAMISMGIDSLNSDLIDKGWGVK